MTPAIRVCPVCKEPVMNNEYHIVPADHYVGYGEPILNLYPHQSCWRECWSNLALYTPRRDRKP